MVLEDETSIWTRISVFSTLKTRHWCIFQREIVCVEQSQLILKFCLILTLLGSDEGSWKDEEDRQKGQCRIPTCDLSLSRRLF